MTPGAAPAGRPGADIEITVAGTSRAAVPPEQATLSLTVSDENRDLPTAVQTASALVGRVRSRIEELSAAPQAASVTWSSIQPIRTSSWRYGDPDGSGRQPVVHAASAQVRVRVRRLRGARAVRRPRR